jgi:hypothetical protein
MICDMHVACALNVFSGPSLFLSLTSGLVQAKRKEARAKLLQVCPFRWDRGGKIKFLDFLGSGINSTEDAVEYLFNILDEAWIGYRPPIPAVNRWNKVFAPWCWWLFGLLFYDVSKDALVEVEAAVQGMLDMLGSILDMARPGDEATYRTLKSVHWRKIIKFISDPKTPRRLRLVVTVWRQGLVTLGEFFKRSRFGAQTSVLEFCSPYSSPAERLMCELGEMLQNPDSDKWALVKPPEGWDDDTLHDATVSILSFFGQTYLKNVQPFEEWPWDLCLSLGAVSLLLQYRSMCIL